MNTPRYNKKIEERFKAWTLSVPIEYLSIFPEKSFGQFAECPRCHKNHNVHYSFVMQQPEKVLAFVICKNNRSYLVAINGKPI